MIYNIFFKYNKKRHMWLIVRLVITHINIYFPESINIKLTAHCTKPLKLQKYQVTTKKSPVFIFSIGHQNGRGISIKWNLHRYVNNATTSRCHTHSNAHNLALTGNRQVIHGTQQWSPRMYSTLYLWARWVNILFSELSSRVHKFTSSGVTCKKILPNSTT